jgi:23S rRNA (uracil1939-C5)-methyltransferase
VELDPEAVAVARTDAPRGWRVVEGRVEDSLAPLLPADLVLLNPPRKGLHKQVPDTLREGGAGRVIYVSCDPATLARDLKRLDTVYRLEGLEAFDLFPQTAHVECVALLTRIEN